MNQRCGQMFDGNINCLWFCVTKQIADGQPETTNATIATTPTIATTITATTI